MHSTRTRETREADPRAAGADSQRLEGEAGEKAHFGNASQAAAVKKEGQAAAC